MMKYKYTTACRKTARSGGCRPFNLGIHGLDVMTAAAPFDSAAKHWRYGCRTGAVAAVNGDYFNTGGGAPIGGQVSGG
jgi:hypothetical protein